MSYGTHLLLQRRDDLMNLSKQTSDAIQMLACCYRAGDELAKVAIIAEELELTKQMALKLANILSQADLVETYRGPSGGIRLTGAARDATLGQIVRKLERAPVQKSVKRQDQLDGFIDDAFEAFLDVLDRNTLRDIAIKKKSTKSTKSRPKSKTRSAKRRPAQVGAASRTSKDQRASRL